MDALVESLLSRGMPDGPAALTGEQWLHRLGTLKALLNGFDNSFTVTVTRADGIHVYVQVAREDTTLVAEAVSNEYLSSAGVLGPEQVSRLIDLGWSPPDDDHSPNFVRRSEATPSNREELAAILALTLRDVYGVAADDEWGLLPDTLVDKLISYQAVDGGVVTDFGENEAEGVDTEEPAKGKVGSPSYPASMDTRVLQPDAALDWRFFDIRVGGRIIAAAAYRPGEYVYCQRGPDDGGLQAAADEGLARDESTYPPRHLERGGHAPGPPLRCR